MDWVSVLAIYAIVWWLVLFMVLPFGVRQVDDPEPGHEPGAPARPMLVIKAVVTSVIAAVVTGVIWIVIANDWVNFRAPPA
jgi:predicted secreted protein